MKDRAARTVRLAPPQHASCDASKSTGERSITPDTRSLSLRAGDALQDCESRTKRGGRVCGGRAGHYVSRASAQLFTGRYTPVGTPYSKARIVLVPEQRSFQSSQS